MILMSYGDSKFFWVIPKPARIPPPRQIAPLS